MKVKLKCGDSITIPKGCKAIVKDGSVVFEKEEKEEVSNFKDGDILVAVVNGKRRNAFIYKSTDVRGFHLYYAGINTFEDLLINDSPNECRWGRSNQILSHATEEEKQLLFDKMKEQRLLWNAEEKRVEKIRWRAKRGEYYFELGRTTFEVYCYTENFDEIDAKLYNCGNYFRTQEQATEAAKRVREALRQYHKEIGE